MLSRRDPDGEEATIAEFSLLLSELMRARGITEPRELSVQLTGAGYWFTEDTVRDYMSGRVEGQIPPSDEVWQRCWD